MIDTVLVPQSIHAEATWSGSHTGTASNLQTQNDDGIIGYPHRNKWYWLTFTMTGYPGYFINISNVNITYRVKALASFIEPSTIALCGNGGWEVVMPENYCGPYGKGDTDWHVFSLNLPFDPRTGMAWTDKSIKSAYFGYGNWGGYYNTEDTSFLTDYLWVTVTSAGREVVTLPATNITQVSAQLNGNNRGGVVASCCFKYGIYDEDWNTIATGTTTPQNINGAFHAHLNLPIGWYKVWFTAFVKYSGETCYGYWECFENPIETLPATQVGMNCAILNGLYSGMDPAQLYFHLGTGEMVFYGLGANTYMWVARYGLTPSTTYTYRAVARIARVYSYGEWVSFTTTAEPVVPPYIPPPNYTTDPSKFIFVPKRKLTV